MSYHLRETRRVQVSNRNQLMMNYPRKEHDEPPICDRIIVHRDRV
jgi:hypothetical protein